MHYLLYTVRDKIRANTNEKSRCEGDERVLPEYEV